MMTEQELISKLQSLKKIKPRESWVVLAKSQILDHSTSLGAKNKVFEDKTVKSSVFSDILGMIFQRKLAYALAAFLFVVAGLFGVMKYNAPNDTTDVKIVQQSQESLVAIKSDVEDFKAKSKNLSQIAQSNSQDITLAVKEVKEAANELTKAIKNDPQLAKEVALDINNNKTYLDIAGGDDLKETSDILYKTIDEQMIKDLENTTLTESQQKALNIAKDLYNERKYSSALESILLLDMSMKSN